LVQENVTYHHTVNIYYDDTDFSGVVYHANYLKYFEHAREHAIGQEELARMWEEDGLGFVVYKVEMQFAEGAVFGDALDIRSHCVREGAFRLNWFHEVWRPGGSKAAVTGMVQLVCINRERRPVPIPDFQYDV
jgi:tol-pal system-associated acyl-CoA thioesterase